MGLELFISLAGLRVRERGESAAAGFRADVAWARGAGLGGVVLDGAAAGMRARELDRSGRRDIAAILRREGMGFGGIDLWVPPEHFADAAQQDRAVAAVVGAIELAGEIAKIEGVRVGDGAGGARAVVSVTLPRAKSADGGGGVPADVVATIAARADAAGVVVADYAWPLTDNDGVIGAGLDPAAALLRGEDAVMLAGRLGARLAGARLSDASTVTRVAPGAGDGRLDIGAYRAVLESVGYRGGGGAVVADLRGLEGQEGAGARALGAWGKSVMSR